MKVKATQSVPVNVELDEDEVYRIVRDEVMRLYGLTPHHGYGWYEVRGDILYKVWVEEYGPYDPDKLSEEVRKATDDDISACDILNKLFADYKGRGYNRER